MDKKRFYIYIGLLAACLNLVFTYVKAEPIADKRKLLLFYSPTCHRCAVVKSKLMPDIEKRFREKIDIEYRDITNIKNYKLLLGFQERYGAKDVKYDLPVFYFQGSILGGQVQLEKALPELIEQALAKPAISEVFPADKDLLSHFLTFSPFTIISAGLIDGINPCAFTVIIFFLSFLALQGYRKRQMAIIGLSFIFSVFITYILIGLGLFTFLYSLGRFWLISRIVNFSIGIFSVILGIFCIYDFFKFKQTKKTEGLVLQLPAAVKNKIHKIIGAEYRKSTDSKGRQHQSVFIFSLILSALTTGFLVSILEAVCTGQVYLPTITFVLKSTRFKLEALGYLLLYNLMFILPLIIIFLFALRGVTSEQLAKVFKKYFLLIKILMAVLFFTLGVFLVFSNILPVMPRPSSNKEIKVENETTSLKYKITPTEASVWDFGQAQEGEVLKHIFEFKNTSDKVLKIKDVYTSCGCTVSSVAKKTLAPQESTDIKVEFHSKGYSGEIKQYLYVMTDDLHNPVIRFTIKAKVIKK